MSRLEKYREARKTRRMYISAFLLFFLLILPGVIIADSSTNFVMKNQNQTSLVEFNKLGDNYFEVSVLDKKYHIDIRFVKRDFQNLKNSLSGLFGKSK